MKKKIVFEQLTLFDVPKNENDLIWEAITELKESHNKVRKRVFQELKDLKSSMIEMKSKQEILTAFIQEWRQLNFNFEENIG